jgi:type IV secretion system protein VirD4
MTAPTPVALPVSQNSMLLRVSGMLLLGVIVYSFMDAMPAITEVGKNLQDSAYPARAGIEKSNMIGLLNHCYNFAACHKWGIARFMEMFGMWHAALLALPFVPIGLMFKKTKSDAPEFKNPGSAEWADEKEIAPYSVDANTHENPMSGYMGQLIHKDLKKKNDLIVDPPALLLPQESWCQNTIVQGGVGSGKTTGFFQANGALAAHLGQTLILIDTKWPQSDSGLREMLGYWRAMGRDVLLYTPFEPTSLRLPMDDNISSFEEGLRFADAVMPPPEFRDEVGEHYKQNQRRMLAAQARVNVLNGGNLKDLRSIALMTLDQHKEWIQQIADPDKEVTTAAEGERVMLRLIMDGAMSRGDKDFMDGMAAILSAMRVFFNEPVIRATTAGAEDETILLETAFRKPTLVYFGVNQEDMLDGSGTILIRLFFRRLIQAVFRVSKSTKNGKLPHLATIQMDEQPSYGRINYLMRISATMRSYHFAIVFGIQNNAQGQLVYGEQYWEAISENVISRRIVFPRGLSGKDAKDISERIGLTSAGRTSYGMSSSQTLLGSDSRTTTTSSVQSMPLLPIEDFSTFGVGEAVVISSHHKPIRTVFTPITFPGVMNKAVRKDAENWIHEFYQEMMTRVPEGLSMSEYSNKLIKSGTFTRLSMYQKNQNRVEIINSPKEAQTVFAPSGSEVLNIKFVDWARAVLDYGVEVSQEAGIGKYHIDIGKVTLPKEESNVDAFIAGKLLVVTGTSFHYRITDLGKKVLGTVVMEEFKEMKYLYPVWAYLRRRGALIENHPTRNEIAVADREPAVGRIEGEPGSHKEVLKLISTQLEEIYPVAPRPYYERVRERSENGRDRYVFIPIYDAKALMDAFSAKDQEEEERQQAVNEKLRQQKQPPARNAMFTKAPPEAEA